jgi:hypothetical protein
VLWWGVGRRVAGLAGDLPGWCPLHPDAGGGLVVDRSAPLPRCLAVAPRPCTGRSTGKQPFYRIYADHCTTQATNLKAVEQCNPSVRRKCILSGRYPKVVHRVPCGECIWGGRSSKVGHRMPCGGGGHGFGSIPWRNKSDAKLDAGEQSLRDALDVQSQVWALFPRQYAALLAVNQSAGLLASDGHVTHGQSPVPNLAGISHMHITSKGLRLDSTARGFSCEAHCDGDFPLDSTSQASTFSLGAWWPLGKPGPDCAFGFHRHMCSLTRPLAACFNSQMPHGSTTCYLGPGDDVVGTSTEISARDVLHCDKRAGNRTHVHN